jgi:hypothetical protein
MGADVTTGGEQVGGGRTAVVANPVAVASIEAVPKRRVVRRLRHAVTHAATQVVDGGVAE